MSRNQNRGLRPIAMLLIVAGLVSACGSAATDAPASQSPSAAAPSSPTDPPPEPTEIPPTDTPAPTPTPELPVVVYEDPEGDCLDNNNVPAVCIPAGLDILRVTISEESPLTIMIEVALPGFEELQELDFFGLTFGIDFDRDATTGNTSFWPDLHLLGPDIEIHHIESGGEILEGITHYAPDGTMTEGDASQAIWTFLDANHIQVVLSDDLVNSPSIGVGGDLFAPGVYDHFVDDGHITFPEGEVILPE